MIVEQRSLLARLALPGLPILAFLLLASGCERGCARTWLNEHGVRGGQVKPPAASPLTAVDCPDGLARCSAGVVEVSRLTSIPQPCKGSSEECACPWDRLGECERGCVADELDVVVERGAALRQLCAPSPEAGAVARVLASPPPSRCDEEQLYRCAGSSIVSCAEHAVVGICTRGCTSEGASLEGDNPVTREAAFAILCSR